MTTIGLYRVDTTAKTLCEVPETDFAALGLKERYDLQEWIEKSPSILGEDLLIVAKECNSFDATAERADLIAIDKLGNLVVIELKRDDSGTNVHWQAVKYASYFARAKADVIAELLAKHAQVSTEEATTRILEFTEQEDLGAVNREQRIILVSHRFAREVTSAVLWLRNHGADISCVQLTPYSDATTGALYMQATTIIPVPGTDGYAVTAASPMSAATAASSGRGKKEDDVTAFLRRVWSETGAKLNPAIKPDKTSRWAGVSGDERYFNVWYQHSPWQPYLFQYKLSLHQGEGGGRELSVGFEFVDAAAEKAGLQAVQLNALKASMQAFGASSDRTCWIEPGKWAWCGVNLPAGTLDDSLRDKAALALQALIEHFTPAVEDLFKAVNEQGS